MCKAIELTRQLVRINSTNPGAGESEMAAFVQEYLSDLDISLKTDEVLPVHDELGPSTVTFGQIAGGYQPYVVPDECAVWMDFRLSPPTDDRKVLEIVEEAIADTKSTVPGITVDYQVTGNRPYVEKNEASLLLARLKAAAERVTEEECRVSTFPGYTDTAVIAGKLGNRECMSYGPGSLKHAHKPDEYVETSDIRRCEAVLEALAEEMLCCRQ